MPVPRTRPYIEFLGVKFSLDNDGYYKTGRTRRQKAFLLHREIWAHANGPIPDGWVVHHIDHDRSNNDLSNLVAIPAAEHDNHHAPGRGWGTWTAERRSAQRRDDWAKRQPTERTCLNCGKVYSSTGQRAKYCNEKCRVDYNRERIRAQGRQRYAAAKLRAANDGAGG